MLDIDAFTDAIVDGAKNYIDQVCQPILARVAALEARPAPVARDGVGVERAIRDASGALNLVLSNGALLNVGNVDGRDGKDVDLIVLREMVAQEVAQIPPAAPGRDADVAEVAALLKAEIEAPLRRQVEEAIAAIPEPRNGVDADPEVTARLVADLVEKRFAELPVPKDGRDGADADPVEIERMVLEAVAGLPLPPPGRDADPAEITRQVAEAVAALPPARDGKDADLAVIERMVAEAVEPLSALTMAEVERAVAAIPKPQDGRSVTEDDIRPIVERAVDEVISTIPAPKDGVGVTGALINRSGELVLTLSDGSMRELGQVVGKDVDMSAVERLVLDEVAKIPHPKDGRDGVGFDDIEVVQQDERNIVIRFVRGDVVKEFPFAIPAVLDRGVWREGAYTKGDGVTWAGSYWIAQEDTTDKPEISQAWRLSAKRGRDGKDGKPGERGAPGRAGKDYGQL